MFQLLYYYYIVEYIWLNMYSYFTNHYILSIPQLNGLTSHLNKQPTTVHYYEHAVIDNYKIEQV